MLTAAQLFTPAPSGVGPYGFVPGQPASGTWLQIMLGIAQQVQLPTTSWQSGAPERTILAIQAVTFSMSDVNISIMAQGGFLQTAASGSVTTTATDGTVVTIPVTPDPSNAAQNPTGALGWLDLLGTNVYDVSRLPAAPASGPLAIVNLKPSSVGPYVAGGYHVGNTNTGASYSNESSLTIPSSIIAGSGGTVINVQPGLATTIVTTSAAHGLAVGQVVYLAIPSSAGISFGTSGNTVFATVTGVTTFSFSINASSSGTYTGGTLPNGVYLCTIANFSANIPGSTSNATPGSVTTTITQNAGVFVSNVIGWSGANWENNVAYANRCQLSLAIRSPNGPAQAYVFYAQSAYQILSTGVLPTGQTVTLPVYLLTSGPMVATEFTGPEDGVVTTVVASLTPASVIYGQNVTPGVSQLLITGVSNANPAVVTTAVANTLLVGETMTVTISGVLGTAGVNGTFTATGTSTPNQFTLPIDTTSAGTYTGGGSVEGGDLGQVDALLQKYVVPDNTTAVTVSALALPVQVVATVVVPQAYVATYQLAVQTQLQVQFATYAIGGNAPDFMVAYDDIIGALEEAGVLALGQASYVRQISSLTLIATGAIAGVGVPIPPLYQAILVSATISVIGV
jgi:hypothetical protein